MLIDLLRRVHGNLDAVKGVGRSTTPERGAGRSATALAVMAHGHARAAHRTGRALLATTIPPLEKTRQLDWLLDRAFA